MGLNGVRLRWFGVLPLIVAACGGVDGPPPKGRPGAIDALKAAAPLRGDYRLQPMMADDRSPTAGQLSARLGVAVEPIPNEPNQFLLRAEPGSVDVSKVGTVHTDVGYAVGVTLPSGTQVGFRYVPK